MMRKILEIIIFFAMLALLWGCGGYRTLFISNSALNPQSTVNSILNIYGISLKKNDKSYLSWPSAAYYTSDSTFAADYILTVTEKDTTYIISVTVFRNAVGDSILNAEVNARKEIR